MNEDKKNFTFEEKVVADKVADGILTVEDDKDNKKYFFLVLLFLSCLIFLVSSLSFAIFDTYYNGGESNIIDVGIDVIIDDDNTGDKDDINSDTGNKNDSGLDTAQSTNKDNSNNNSSNSVNPIPGSVLFSFNEGSSYINMVDVYPMKDSLGKKLTGNNQFFDFNVSASLNNNKSGNLIYEISLVPIPGNTINENDVRVYLTENGSAVSVLENNVNNYSDLPTSEYHEGGKVIYRKVVNDKFYGNYVFRMWLSSEAQVSQISEKFGCKVTVDAYYK